ncbi:signal peptidase II [Salinifilum ghardaiensis]
MSTQQPPSEQPHDADGSSAEPERSQDGDERAAEPGGTGAGDERAPRPRGSRRLLALLFGIAAGVLVLDALTKIAVVATLEGGPPVRLLGGLVYLDVLRNPGAAFSLATGMTWLLALLAIGFVAGIVWLAPKLRSTGWGIGLGLVLGGACGNLGDRLFREPGPLRGHVVDFISVFAPNGAYFPVFNIADSSIVCGGALVILLSLLGRDYDGTVQRKRGKRAEDDT